MATKPQTRSRTLKVAAKKLETAVAANIDALDEVADALMGTATKFSRSAAVLRTLGAPITDDDEDGEAAKS